MTLDCYMITVLSMVANIKLEWVKQRKYENHFAIKVQIYLFA